MLQMRELVLILIGAEVVVVMVTSLIVWRRWQVKRSGRLTIVSDEERLHREADDIVMEYMMNSGVHIEAGRPSVSHLSSRRDVSSVGIRKETAQSMASVNRYPNRVNPSWDPDLLSYNSKPRPSEDAISYDRIRTGPETRRVSYPPSETDMTPFPDSEYSSILRGDITSPINSDDQTNYSIIASINTPKSTTAHGTKRGSDVRTLNSIFLTSRPRMSVPSPFDVYSNSDGYLPSHMDATPHTNSGGHVRFESLWKD